MLLEEVAFYLLLKKIEKLINFCFCFFKEAKTSNIRITFFHNFLKKSTFPTCRSTSKCTHNLSKTMTKSWLCVQLSKHEDMVLDVYLSVKNRRTSLMLFGFVWFHLERETLRAIERLNELEIRGHKILVKEVAYSRRSYKNCLTIVVCTSNL